MNRVAGVASGRGGSPSSRSNAFLLNPASNLSLFKESLQFWCDTTTSKMSDGAVAFKKRKLKRETQRTTDASDVAPPTADDPAVPTDPSSAPDAPTPLTKRPRPAVGVVSASTRVESTEKDKEAQPLGAVASTFSADRDTTRDHAAAVTEIDPIVNAADRSRAPSMRSGPMRQSNTIAAISSYDYQPDVCKDYRDSGRCRWGDNCKFLHDRGGYKSGAQMERDWNAKQKEKQALLAKGLTTSGSAETSGGPSNPHGYPSACPVCEQPFTDPVVTSCNHYSCEACALKHFREAQGKCPVCKGLTHGIFNAPPASMKKYVDALRDYNAAAAAAGTGGGSAAAATGAEEAAAARAEAALLGAQGQQSKGKGQGQGGRTYQMGWAL